MPQERLMLPGGSPRGCRLYLGLVTAGVGLALAGMVGCEVGPGDPTGEPSPLGLIVGTLESQCAGDGNPFALATAYRVCGQAEVNATLVGIVPRLFFDAKTSAKEGRLEIKKVPAYQGYEVTVVGLGADGQPTHLARQKNVSVADGETRNLTMTLVPYNDSACLSVEQAGNLAHRIFPAAVVLGDGRIFVTGGFTSLLGDGAQKLGAPSDQTYIVDPHTGVVSAGPQLNEGRGGHVMIYVAARKQVLVIGGAREMPWSPASGALAFGHNSTEVLSSIEIVDFSTSTPQVLPDMLGMINQRIFPHATLAGADRVIITGGGGWPTPSAAYQKVDYIVWDSGADRFTVASNSFFAQDTAARAGHSVTFLSTETVNGTPQDVHLLWGGTSTDARASLLVSSSDPGQQAFFQTPELLQDTPERTFFHAATRLGDNRVLITGGASYQGNVLGSLSGSSSYLLSYGRGEGGNPSVSVQQLTGFGGGRVFHSALSNDGRRVAIIGGFATLDGDALSSVVYFDASTLTFSTTPAPRIELAARGGHAAVFTPADALYLAGGVADLDDLKANEAMLSEMFVPASVGFCDAPKFDSDEVEGE